jgi:hypothetical protein
MEEVGGVGAGSSERASEDLVPLGLVAEMLAVSGEQRRGCAGASRV